MAGKTHEARFKDLIKEVLKKHKVFYFMPVPLGMGKHGVPDFICCLKGEFLAIEVKGPKGKLTKNQEVCMAEIKDSNGITVVINSEVNIEALEQFVSLRIKRHKKTSMDFIQ